MNLKDFYLKKIVNRAEYIMIQIAMIPQEFVEKYNLQEKEHHGNIYAKVIKVIYGLPQSGRISNDALVKRPDPYGYRLSSKNPGLCTPKNQPINFTLLVDDFGVKYS